MLVRAVRGFVPPVGGPVSPGDIFELPDGVDWLKCGLVIKAEAGAKASEGVAVEPQPVNAGGKPHAQLRENVREVIRTSKPKAEHTEANVEGAVAKVLKGKQAAKAKKKAA